MPRSSIITLRRIGPTEKRISLLAVLYLTAITVNGVLMIHQFRVPTRLDVALIMLAGIVGGFGQIAMLAATRLAPANRVTPTQYSQIIWAIILGAVFFGEFPDQHRLRRHGAGGAARACSRSCARSSCSGWSRRTFVMRNRP